MNWFDVAKVIAPLAPTLGGLIGGFIPFPGAGAAGQAIGTVIARQFGVPATPEAVHNAVTTSANDVAIAKLNAAAEEAKAMWPAIAEMEKAMASAAGSVNETMRAELGREHWFFNGWRPAAGWLFVVFATIDGLLLTVAIWRAGRGDPLMLNVAKEAQVLVGAHLASLAAIVGIYIFGRSYEKSKAIENGTVATPPQPAKPRK